MRLDVSYVLPLRWSDDAGLIELASYLGWLAQHVEVIVVDGSAPELFAAHASAWADRVVHVAPDPDLRFRNGKVNGVTTGVRRAAHEKVVIADDDVRYGSEDLVRVAALLDRHDLVRPQNYFAPAVWHAVWDSARTLLNRATGRDFPGTLGFRKSAFERTGGYDGDVMFENLELIRTVRAAGGTEAAPLDLYVRRLPPEASHFFAQRIRQAFDDLALPHRLVLWLAIVPLVATAAVKRATRPMGGAALGAVVIAEVGRRRAGGTRYFPAAAALCAPGWLVERGICMWLALAQRVLRGGVRYQDGIIEHAATPERELQRRFG